MNANLIVATTQDKKKQNFKLFTCCVKLHNLKEIKTKIGFKACLHISGRLNWFVLLCDMTFNFVKFAYWLQIYKDKTFKFYLNQISFFHISAFEVLPSVIWYFSGCLLLTQSLALTHTCILSQYSHTPIAPICINTQQRLNKKKEMIKWKKRFEHMHMRMHAHTHSYTDTHNPAWI